VTEIPVQAPEGFTGFELSKTTEIVLVPDLADDLLEDVLGGDDAVEHAVLVDDRAD